MRNVIVLCLSGFAMAIGLTLFLGTTDLKKDDTVQVVASPYMVGILDAHVPSVSPDYGKSVSVFPDNDIDAGFISAVKPFANSPPVINQQIGAFNPG